jgi:hypothetical protein
MHFMIGFGIFVLCWGLFPRVMGWITLLAVVALVLTIGGSHQ